MVKQCSKATLINYRTVDKDTRIEEFKDYVHFPNERDKYATSNSVWPYTVIKGTPTIKDYFKIKRQEQNRKCPDGTCQTKLLNACDEWKVKCSALQAMEEGDTEDFRDGFYPVKESVKACPCKHFKPPVDYKKQGMGTKNIREPVCVADCTSQVTPRVTKLYTAQEECTAMAYHDPKDYVIERYDRAARYPDHLCISVNRNERHPQGTVLIKKHPFHRDSPWFMQTKPKHRSHYTIHPEMMSEKLSRFTVCDQGYGKGCHTRIPTI